MRTDTRTNFRFSKLSTALAVAAALALMACGNEPAGGGGGDGPALDGGATQVDGGGTLGDLGGGGGPVIDPVDPALTAEQQAFAKSYAEVLKQAQTMELGAFQKQFTPANPAGAPNLGYDALKSQYVPLIDEKLKLTAAEKAKLAENGFVVSGRLAFPTMAQALLKVYEYDLPVMVTSDMILQALHESYDDVLKTLEHAVLVKTIEAVLAKSQVALKALDPGAAVEGEVAKADADFYISVARSLLAGSQVESLTGAAVDDQVKAFLGHIDGLQMKDVEIFGKGRTMDFSQFKPRGHYEGDVVLERYFRAMMWLGRADLRFVEFDAYSGTWRYNPRQVMVAMALRSAAEDGGAMTGWHQADDLIGLMVGPVDYMDFSGLGKLVNDQGWKTVSDIAGMSKAQSDAMIAKLVSGQYGAQKIASHYLETDPFSAEPTPLPPSFAFLGQRFVVDSHVFANVVYDRVIYKGTKVKRVLPDPLDALFVLGNDQVLPLLEGELKKFPYQGNLLALRFLVDSYKPDFWESNVYNMWLHALRALNAPTTAEGFPKAMKSTAWRNKTAHTQLASWAQLRHDTLLYAKQSYTGGVACEHPDGFVEPVPEFYARLQTLAKLAGQAMANATFEGPGLKTMLAKHFESWDQTMGKLKTIAEKELKKEDLSTEEVQFLKETIMAQMGCGSPIFSGWYTSLYFSAERVDKWRPTIADVHTNPNSGPLPGPNVLHVGTSNVELMILTADRCDGAAAFVGPVMRYHTVDIKEIKRLADSDWEKMLKDKVAPPQPGWTESYRVP